MPLITNEQIPQRTEERKRQELEQTEAPSFGSTMEAAFATANSIGSITAFGMPDNQVTKEDFDPFAAIQEAGRPDLIPHVIHADSMEEIQAVIEQSNKEQQYKETLDNAGFGGMAASMAAGVLDPTILIPGTGALKAGSTLFRTAKGLATGAAYGAAALGSQEAVLAVTQLDKTQQDVYEGIATGAIMGGVFGTLLGSLSKPVRSAVQDGIRNVTRSAEPSVVLNTADDIRVRSAGAAGVSKEAQAESFSARKDSESIANISETVVKGVSGAGFKPIMSPITRGLTSRFASVREYTNDLFNHNFIINKNLQGRATRQNVEAGVELARAQATMTGKTVKDLYLDVIGQKPGVLAEEKAFIGGVLGKRMSWGQFNEEVARAMRRGDTHEIPQVAQAASKMRKDIDNLVQEMQDLELMPRDMKLTTARSWLARRYNLDKIRSDEAGNKVFRGIIARKFAADAGQDVTNPEIIERVDATLNNILGIGDQQLQLSTVTEHMTTSAGSFSRKRVLDIPDVEIEEFLVNDSAGIYSSFMHQGSAAVGLKKAMKARGFDSVLDVKKEIRRESDLIVNKLSKELSAAIGEKTKDDIAKQIKDTQKELTEALKEVDAYTRVVLGQYTQKGAGSTPLRLLRKYQTMRLLGGVLISSIPDLAMPIFRQGLGNTLKLGYAPMLRSFKKANLAKNELKHFNIGLELENNNILRSITDPSFDLQAAQSPWEKAADIASDRFGKLTGMTYWNNMGRRLAGQISQGRIMESAEAVAKGKPLSKKEIIRLASLGLEVDDLKTIWKEFHTHGVKDSGSYLTNLENWSKANKDKFGKAILKDVDATILSPSPGDIPLAAQRTELGKTITQFKSFIFSATNKILISGLQRRDKDVLMGLSALVMLGGTVGVLKDMISGRTTDPSPEKFLLNGIAASGVSGLMGESITALNPWFRSQRFAAVSAESFLLGPSAGLVQDSFSTMAGIIGDSELTNKDLEKLRRMVPYQNLFYLRLLMNKIGD